MNTKYCKVRHTCYITVYDTWEAKYSLRNPLHCFSKYAFSILGLHLNTVRYCIINIPLQTILLLDWITSKTRRLRVTEVRNLTSCRSQVSTNFTECRSPTPISPIRDTKNKITFIYWEKYILFPQSAQEETMQANTQINEQTNKHKAQTNKHSRQQTIMQRSARTYKRTYIHTKISNRTN